ncbi:GNAT family N-acetyltransferase [Streptomyces flavofungini]|uniref:GNAT family N-acetyltransferase n=1 Tax=Streptomyces flavofungini TaxID=68200 RepID=A0ABS0X3K2_9ACTN|nr:GNAT family N-acetyltransferase [Streptomyces flavofungini]MBJ3807763.1 GNAT family N-acetyltransferase [Streptomyces flavofungini]GHC79393.1 N-acetyltransferase [Streptomyces flavofungini]
MTEVLVRALRPTDPADTSAFAAVRRVCVPAMLATSASVAFDAAHAHPDAHYRQLVAEADGEVIGTAQTGMAYDSPEPGQSFANVYVHPGHRGVGAGSLLVRTAEEYLAGKGATTVYSWVLDTEENRAFAAHRGYRASRSAHFLRLDLANGELPPLAAAPPGVELRSGAEFAADPRPLFDLDAETVADEPSDVAAEFTDYEHWLAETWHHPLVSQELTTVAVVDGRPAAFSLARTDDASRYASGMTGTARAHRGRGLAKLAKNDSLHRARAAGCTEAFTGNDAGNEPMLAINKWFGYDICDTEVRHVRSLG